MQQTITLLLDIIKGNGPYARRAENALVALTAETNADPATLPPLAAVLSIMNPDGIPR